MNQDEQAIIKQAQGGNTLAFEALVKRYDKHVLQLAYSLVNNTQDAQDVYQEVFVRVFKNLKRFKFQSQFSTWLYRVVVNYCINFNKRKGRAKFFSLNGQAVEQDDEWKKPMKDEARTPEESVLNQELSNAIDLALAQLSARQKTVFVLRHYHGYKLQEIAQIMNCSEGTVKNYLFRATQKMQALLKEYAKI